jgi:hypothetical protein
MRKPSRKQIENRVSIVFARACQGIPVPILSIGAIMRAGVEAASAPGATDEDIARALLATVATLPGVPK